MSIRTTTPGSLLSRQGFVCSIVIQDTVSVHNSVQGMCIMGTFNSTDICGCWFNRELSNMKIVISSFRIRLQVQNYKRL